MPDAAPVNIVLFEPEIPQNAGNIARLCACTGSKLFFIGRLGFSLSDKYMKRSGLDYWDKVELNHYKTFEQFQKENKGNYYFFTTKAKKLYTDVEYKENDYLIFGPESRGLPEEILNSNKDFCVKIPMKENARSLNLANSVAVGVYEAVRQSGAVIWVL